MKAQNTNAADSMQQSMTPWRTTLPQSQRNLLMKLTLREIHLSQPLLLLPPRLLNLPEHPAVPEHLLPAVPEHLDEMSDQPEPSIEPEPPSVPATPMNLDPVTSEAYRTPVAPETFEQQRLRLDKQETLSFGPRRPRHHEQPSPYARPPHETGEMVFEVQDIDTANLPHGWTFNKNNNSLELKQKVS